MEKGQKGKVIVGIIESYKQVKEFSYLGYWFQLKKYANTRGSKRDCTMWRTGNRQFRHNYKMMILFDSLIKLILMYRLGKSTYDCDGF